MTGSALRSHLLQPFVVYFREIPADVSLEDVSHFAGYYVAPQRFERLVETPSGSEPVREFQEILLEYCLQYPRDCSLQ